MGDRAVQLAVVGLGPRGLAVVERASANAEECLPEGHGLIVHVIDPYAGRGGRVWRTDQHAELLMNTVASQISMFVDASVDCEGPIVPGPDLHRWAGSLVGADASAGVPAGMRAEAAGLGPDDYPSRALYGHYLNWTLEHVLRTLPAAVSIRLHAEVATDLRDADDGSQTIRLGDGSVLRGIDAVVLTLGHLPTRRNRSENTLASFARANRLTYVPPGNPADTGANGVEPGETVILRGLGLTFFDHMALMTVGRGGRFARLPGGRLVYRASETEPRLVAGSRRGVPYQARGENQKGASGRHAPLFLTPEVAAELQGRAARGQPVYFGRDVWPLIDREVRAVYYATLLRTRSTGGADRFLRDFVDLRSSSASDGHPFDDAAMLAEDRLLHEHGIDDDMRWNWHRVAHPYSDQALTSSSDYRRWLRAYLDHDIAEAARGNVNGPLKAALDVLRDLRNEIRLVVDHGGLSGDSYRDELQRWYTPLNAYLSIGPPARRIEELGALIDAGVVTVVGPDMAVSADESSGRFIARSRMFPDEAFRATALIEARLPESDLRTTSDPLILNQLARGEARLHRIKIGGGGSYPTGGLAVTPRPYRLRDVSGRQHPRRFAFGVPTETVHWITAAGIRPGVNSVIHADADAVARAGISAGIAAPSRAVVTTAR